MIRCFLGKSFALILTIGLLGVGCSSSDAADPVGAAGSAGAGGSGGSAGSGGAGGSAGNAGNGGSAGASGVVSKQISAAQGGAIETTGAKAEIPPGALSADTTITVEIKSKTGMPDEAKIAAPIFDFGPNGTQFSKPVTLTIDFTGTAPSGTTAKIAYLEGGAWKPLADSASSGGKVVATTTHFTPFTVVWVGGAQAACPDFTPCGGDIVGNWTYSGSCLSLVGKSIEDLKKQCATASLTATIDVTGTVAFNADMTYTTAGTAKMDSSLEFPKSCIPSGITCDQAFSSSKPVDTGTSCVINDSQTTQLAETGTYSSAGTSLVLTKTGGTPKTIEYCVQGSTAKVKETDVASGNIIYYEMTK